MLQELMIQINYKMAVFLFQCFFSMVFLYCQSQFNEAEFELWRQEYFVDVFNFVVFIKFFLDGNKICQCKMACICIINYMKRISNIKVYDFFDVCQVFW